MFRSFRLRRFFYLFIGSKPYQLGGATFFYYCTMILLTDCYVWMAAKSLQNYHWKTLVVYSIFSYPLWMCLGIKGLIKEITEIKESGRWFALDLMPGGPSLVSLTHYLGYTLKMKSFLIWLLIFFAACLYQEMSLTAILVCPLLILTGSAILALTHIIASLLSPHGYGNLTMSLFYSITWILSGAAFPIGMISNKFYFFALNPLSSIMGLPLQLLLKPQSFSLEELALFLLINCLWMTLFYVFSQKIETKYRENLHG